MYFEFFAPVKILSGENAIFNLPNEIERLGCKRPIILTDEGIVNAGIIEKHIKQTFKEMDISIPPIFDKIPQETSIYSTEKALSFFNENNADGIVAIGGGSVIDTSKAISMLLTENKKNLKELMGVDIIGKRSTPFIAVPTTAGTGSETTLVAVILNEKENQKMAFSSHYLIPDVAILDPALTLSLPKKMTAASGLDALSHAIESYISIQSNPISKALAFKATKIIWENLPETITNPANKTARFDLLNASAMAGMAFSNSMVGIVHSLAHAAGSILHIPHGIAVSLFLVSGIRENMETSKKELAELLEATNYKGILPKTDTAKAELFVYLLEMFVKNIRKLSNIPSDISEAGINPELENKIIDLALADGSSIFNKIKLTKDKARKLIETIKG